MRDDRRLLLNDCGLFSFGRRLRGFLGGFFCGLRSLGRLVLLRDESSHRKQQHANNSYDAEHSHPLLLKIV